MRHQYDVIKLHVRFSKILAEPLLGSPKILRKSTRLFGNGKVGSTLKSFYS